MSPVVADLLAAGTEKGKDLPGEPWMIGLGAFTLLVVLLLVTLTFGKDR
ncbi:MAG: hypothetical protein QOJ49_732 [Actinomycetota bacterium]|jgi:hypothetical protein|nr:hypothetical protein [Actinomycetota bacterium]